MQTAVIRLQNPIPDIEIFLARTKKAARKTRETVVFNSRKARVAARKFHTAKPPKKQARELTPKFRKLSKTGFLIIFWLLSIIIFAAVIRGVPGNPDAREIKQHLENRGQPFELSPERGRYAIIKSLDDTKSFALSTDLRDAVYPDVGYYQGRYYSFFAPGISLLAYPLYLLGKSLNLAQVASYSVISLFALLNMFILFKISRSIFHLPTWAALFGATVFAFGSTALSYSNTLYQHQVTAFFIIASFFSVWKFGQRKKFSFLWAAAVWLMYGLAIFIDYPNALLLFPVMVYLLIETVAFSKTGRKIMLSVRVGAIITVLIFAAVTFIHGYYNYVNFGSPTRVSGSLVGYKAVKELHLLDSKKGLEEFKKIETLKTPTNFFEEKNLPKGLFILLFDTDRGIFVYAPIFVLALLNLIYIIPRIDRRYAVLLSVIAVNLFLYASFGDPWGGYAYGPRYLIPSMAILSLFAAEWLYRTKRKYLMRILAFLLFLYSSGIAILGAITTNSVPPKVEAIPLHMPYNFVLNFHQLQDGVSSSFLYNTYFSFMNLYDYFFFLYVTVVILGFSTLFILPIFSKQPYDN